MQLSHTFSFLLRYIFMLCYKWTQFLDVCCIMTCDTKVFYSVPAADVISS